MNKRELKRISKIVSDLSATAEMISALRDGEQTKLDKYPPQFRFSDAYIRAENAHECLDSSLEMIGDVINVLQKVY